MSEFFRHNFTAAAGTELSTTTPDVGTSWVETLGNLNGKISSGGTLYFDTTTGSAYHAVPLLSVAQNTMTLDLVFKAGSGNGHASPMFGVRGSTGGVPVHVEYYESVLYLKSGGIVVDSAAHALAAPGTYSASFVYDNAGTVTAIVDGVTLSASGLATDLDTFFLGHTSGLDASTDTTGIHFDNVSMVTGTGGGSATTYTMTADVSTVPVNQPVTLTLTPDGAFTGTVTLASDGAGTFTPSSLTWTGDNSTKTSVYTPTSAAGSPHTISATNDGGLTDPAGIDVTVVVVDVVVCLGDSFTVNAGVTPTYPDALQDDLGASYSVFNKGVGAQDIPGMEARVGTDVIPFLTGTINYVSVLGGYNDAAAGATAAQILTRLQSCCNAIYSQAVAASKVVKIIVGTLVNAGAVHHAFNNLIRTASAADRKWDAVADHEFHQSYGSADAYADATKYAAGHPTNVVTPMMALTDGDAIETLVYPLATSGGGGVYTAAANVRSGTDRGDGTLGTLVVPAAGDVEVGVTFDNGTAGTFAKPTAAQVLLGVGFGAAGTEFTGTLDPGSIVPGESDTLTITDADGTPVGAGVTVAVSFEMGTTDENSQVVLNVQDGLTNFVSFSGAGIPTTVAKQFAAAAD